jgi:hypothetical protein
MKVNREEFRSTLKSFFGHKKETKAQYFSSFNGLNVTPSSCPRAQK